MRTEFFSFTLIFSVLTQFTFAANFRKVPSPVTVTVTATVTASPSPTTQLIEPKVFIVSFFTPEVAVWQKPLNLINAVRVPGFSPLFPNAYCNPDGSICQVVTGEGEINGASSISALIHSGLFDLTTTYFLTAGIAGINPACGTLGTVALAKYTVQVGLAYEVDSREIAFNYTSGWIPLGAKAPNEYPVFIYGTEVYELNTALRDRAYEVATKAMLGDSVAASKYRKTYAAAPANLPPTIIKGDTMTSDVYWHGELLGNTFEEYTNLLTNSSGRYCMTAQEDNAVLEAMLRGALSKLMDFSRIIVMRTGANFDRPPPHETALQQLLYVDSGGFDVAVQNIYAAGRPIVDDIVKSWDSTYEAGFAPVNYIGNVLGSLEGQNFAADIGSPYYQEG